MARALRIQYPGAIHHVMSRGDRREPIFHDDEDRLLFLRTVDESCEKTSWQIARRLAMGTWSCLSNRLYRAEREPNDRK